MDRLERMRQAFRIAILGASHMTIRQVRDTYGSLLRMLYTYHDINPVTNQNIVIRQPWLVQIAAQSDDGVTQSTEANRMVEAMQPSMPGSAREVWPASGGPEAGSASGGPVPSLVERQMVEAMQPSMPGSAREVFTQSSREVSEIIIRTETIAATSSQQVNPACVPHLVTHSPAICQQRNPACVSHLVTHPPRRPRDGNTLSEIGRPAKRRRDVDDRTAD